MNTREAPAHELRALVDELARVELPTDDKADPGAFTDALDELGPADMWRLVKTLFRLVDRARRLVGTPRRHTEQGKL